MTKVKASIVVLMFIGVWVALPGCRYLSLQEDKTVSVEEEPQPPVFDSNVYMKEGTPPAEDILAALRSDNQESIRSAHILLKSIVSKEKLNWPSGLRKEEVYKHLERHLKSDDMKVVSMAITVVDPERFGDGFYRSEERVQLVQEAIERWNATQSEDDDFFRFYELELNEEGEPVRLIRSAGASVE